MNVNLGPTLDQFVTSLLKTGLYQSQSEVLREALRLLKQREEWKSVRLAELKRKIALGIDQADRGDLVDGTQTFAEIRKRRARHRQIKK
jgi:antitoxin ParD1/3/4